MFSLFLHSDFREQRNILQFDGILYVVSHLLSAEHLVRFRQFTAFYLQSHIH
jgi:hypothetical protein